MMAQAASKQPSEAKKPSIQLEVVAMDMMTPLGADAKSTAAAVKAGISAYQVSNQLNKMLEPMTMALVPNDALPPLADALGKVEGITSRQQRILQLATSPLQKIMETVPANIKLPLMLAGPEKMPGRRSVISDKFIKLLQVQVDATFDLENSYVFPYGRAAAFDAIEAAMMLIEQGVSEYVLVGAVDSYLDLKLLATLDSDDRISAPGIMDGFTPGEASAFMVVKAATEQSRVRLFPPGLADEAGHRYSDEPYKGDGLADAVRESLASLTNGQIQTVLAGFNGEHFNAKEWGVANIRSGDKFTSDYQMEHPADCFGDLGAALGLVLAQLGVRGVLKGYYQGPLLAWCSSEMKQRGAICIA